MIRNSDNNVDVTLNGPEERFIPLICKKSQSFIILKSDVESFFFQNFGFSQILHSVMQNECLEFDYFECRNQFKLERKFVRKQPPYVHSRYSILVNFIPENNSLLRNKNAIQSSDFRKLFQNWQR